jgi:transcriptional regulator GlxA family with amidase domain
MRELVTVLFNDFETLDVFGPIEVLGRLKTEFLPQFYSMHGGTITSSHAVPVLTRPFADIATTDYVLFVPGGMGTRSLVEDEEFVGVLRSLATKAEHVLTVCTGSILFAKTGLLDGRRATSNKRTFGWTGTAAPGVHWIKKARWVRDGNVYTSSGVSAGIDMALGFVADTLGIAVAEQQSAEIEYLWNRKADIDPFADLYP